MMAGDMLLGGEGHRILKSHFIIFFAHDYVKLSRTASFTFTVFIKVHKY